MRANIRDCKEWCIVTVGCVSFRGVGDESWLRVFDGGAKEKTKEKERERERESRKCVDNELERMIVYMRMCV